MFASIGCDAETSSIAERVDAIRAAARGSLRLASAVEQRARCLDAAPRARRLRRGLAALASGKARRACVVA
jgi:hypothetical protein